MKALSTLCVLFSLAASTSTAQGQHGIRLVFESCDDELERELRAAAELEFRALAPTVREHLRDNDRVTIMCSAQELELRIDARSPLSQVVERRTLSPGSRGRVLALTTAELLSAWDEERRLHQEATPAPVVTAPPGSRWALQLGVLALRSGSPSMRRVGGLLRGSYRRGLLGFDLELGGGTGRAEVDEGSVSSRWFSAAATLSIVAGRRMLITFFGLGYRITTASWHGRSTSSAQVGVSGRALWSGPLLRARTQLRVERFVASIWGELGYALSSPDGFADERAVLSAAGLWGSGGVSCGLSFP